jgi:hypothetical protein
MILILFKKKLKTTHTNKNVQISSTAKKYHTCQEKNIHSIAIYFRQGHIRANLACR